jgi:hypothetical protein
MAPANERVAVLHWNTGSTPAGSYRVRGELYLEDTFLGSAADTFEILGPTSVSASISTDHPEYGANETVRINSQAKNEGANVTLQGLTAKVAVRYSGEDKVVWDKNAFFLLPGGTMPFQDFWNVTTSTPGAYQAVIKVFAGEQLLAEATTDFAIRPSTDDCNGLMGTITADPREVAQPTVNLAFEVKNVGNTTLEGTVEIAVVDPATRQEVGTPCSKTFWLTPGQTAADGCDHSIEGLTGNTLYAAVGRYKLDGWQEGRTCPLGRSPFRVLDGTPPVVGEFEAPVLDPGECLGGPFELRVHVTDDVSGVASVEYGMCDPEQQPASWFPMEEDIANPGIWAATVPQEVFGGQGDKVIWVRAADQVGNNWDSDPGDNNPASLAVRIDLEPPTISVVPEPVEGWIYPAPVNITVDADDSLGITEYSITLNGQAQSYDENFVSEIHLDASGEYTIAASAHDCSGHETTFGRTFEVDATPPAVGEFYEPALGPGECIGASFDLRVHITDDVSGVATAEYAMFDPANPPGELTWVGLTLLEGTANDGTWGATVPVSEGDHGNKRILVRSADLVGNNWDSDPGDNNPAALDFAIDMQVPTISVVPEPVEGWLYHAPVDITVDADDSLGITQYDITVNGEAQSYDENFVSEIHLDTSGEYTIAASAHDCSGHETTFTRTFKIQIFNVTKASDPTFKRVLLFDYPQTGRPNTEAALASEAIFNETVTTLEDFITRFRTGIFPVAILFDAPIGGQTSNVYVDLDPRGFAGSGIMAVPTVQPGPMNPDLADLFGSGFGSKTDPTLPEGSISGYYEIPSPVSGLETGTIKGTGCLINRTASQIFGWVEDARGSRYSGGAECQGLFSIQFEYGKSLESGQQYSIKLEAWDAVGKVDEQEKTITVPSTGPWGDGLGERAQVILDSVSTTKTVFTLAGLDTYRLESGYKVTLTISQYGVPIDTVTGYVSPTCSVRVGDHQGPFIVDDFEVCDVYDDWAQQPPRYIITTSSIHRWGAGAGLVSAWDLEETLGMEPDLMGRDLLMDALDFLTVPYEAQYSREVLVVTIAVENSSAFSADLRVTETLPSDSRVAAFVEDEGYQIEDTDPPVFLLQLSGGQSKTIRYMLHMPSGVGWHDVSSTVECYHHDAWNAAGDSVLSKRVLQNEFQFASDLHNELSQLCTSLGDQRLCNVASIISALKDPLNPPSDEDGILYCRQAYAALKVVLKQPNGSSEPFYVGPLLVRTGHLMELWHIKSVWGGV